MKSPSGTPHKWYATPADMNKILAGNQYSRNILRLLNLDFNHLPLLYR